MGFWVKKLHHIFVNQDFLEITLELGLGFWTGTCTWACQFILPLYLMYAKVIIMRSHSHVSLLRTQTRLLALARQS